MKEWQFWTVTGLAGVALLAVVVNIIFFIQNRSVQIEINNRQLFINQSAQLDQLNREIITALANLAVKNNDQDIRQLLTTHGITVSVNPSGGGGADAGDAARKGRK